MQLAVRRTALILDERREEAGRIADTSLRKLAVVTIIQNPMLGAYAADLSPLIEASAGLGREMGERAMRAFDGEPVQSFGKGGIVGLGGEQEHANALLTTAFANPFREAIGGGVAWVSSMTKVAAPGTLIDIPMNHKDDIYVRSHYDGMSLVLPDAPLPDEIAIIFCVANRGRLNARVGGLTHEEVKKRRAG